MTKAKTIDRLELTRQKFGGKLKGSKSTVLAPQVTEDIKTVGQTIIEGLKEAIDDVRKHGFPTSKPKHSEEDDGLKECPNCGAKSLRLDGGCMSCLSCGWSACG